MTGKIKLILGKLMSGSEHLGDVYFTEAENEILSLIDKEIIGEDEDKGNLQNNPGVYTAIANRNMLREEQRKKLRA